MKQIILLIGLAFLLNSCATVFCGSKKRIVFDSPVKQTATLTIDGQKHSNVTFPYTAKVRRGFDQTIVKAETEGYEPALIYINKNFNAVSVINLIDILGWGIDAATGAMTKPEYNQYEIEFVKSK